MLDLLYNNGDLKADEYGDLVLCADESVDVIQMANNNILLRLGHNKYHNELGNGVYIDRIKANSSGLNDVKDQCIRAIVNGDNRVMDVLQMNVIMDGDGPSCIVDYKLRVGGSDSGQYEIDGRVQVNPFNI